MVFASDVGERPVTAAGYDPINITEVHEVKAWWSEGADVQMGQSVIYVAGWRRELGEANHPKIWA